MLYCRIDSWSRFKECSGRSCTLSDAACELLYEYYSSLPEIEYGEDIEINWNTLHGWDEYDSFVQFLKLENSCQVKIYKSKLESQRQIAYVKSAKEPCDPEFQDYEVEDNDEELEELCKEYTLQNYERVLFSYYSVVIDSYSKKC